MSSRGTRIYDGRVNDPAPRTDTTFLESLMDTDLYSIGAFFCDQHPDLVEEVIARSAEIEKAGLSAYAVAAEIDVEEAFDTLLTGLAVRYYTALAG